MDEVRNVEIEMKIGELDHSNKETSVLKQVNGENETQTKNGSCLIAKPSEGNADEKRKSENMGHNCEALYTTEISGKNDVGMQMMDDYCMKTNPSKIASTDATEAWNVIGGCLMAYPSEARGQDEKGMQIQDCLVLSPPQRNAESDAEAGNVSCNGERMHQSEENSGNEMDARNLCDNKVEALVKSEKDSNFPCVEDEKETQIMGINKQISSVQSAEICKDVAVVIRRISWDQTQHSAILPIGSSDLSSQRQTRPRKKKNYKKLSCGCVLCNDKTEGGTGGDAENGSPKSNVSTPRGTIEDTENDSIHSLDVAAEESDASKTGESSCSEDENVDAVGDIYATTSEVSDDSKRSLSKGESSESINEEGSSETEESDIEEDELSEDFNELNLNCDNPPCDTDHFLYCEKCNGMFHGECPIDGPEICMQDKAFDENSGTKRAIGTLPDELYLDESSIPGAGIGVFAKTEIDERVRFGPYTGVAVIDDVIESGYQWQIISKQRVSHYIDAEDKDSSNWMRFINCARTESEQNLIAFQYRSQIYYRTYKRISPMQELLVWYGDPYGKSLGLVDTDKNKDRTSLSTIRRICMRCFRVFDSATQLGWHEKSPCPRSHSQCSFCGMLFKNETFLANHLSWHGGNDRTHFNASAIFLSTFCRISGCFKDFPNTECLKKHLMSEHSQDHRKCKLCRLKFTSTLKLQAHILKQHEGKAPWQCSECDRGFQFSSALSRHLPLHTGLAENVCHQCHNVFSTAQSLAKHRPSCRLPEFPFGCFRCRKGFKSQQDAIRHIHYECQYRAEDRKGNISIREKGSFLCDYPNCKNNSESCTALNRHYITSHMNSGETRKLLSKNLNGRSIASKYYCTYCKISFGTAKADFYHQKTHGILKKCPTCNESYRTYKELVKHIRSCKLIKRGNDTGPSMVQHSRGSPAKGSPARGSPASVVPDIPNNDPGGFHDVAGNNLSPISLEEEPKMLPLFGISEFVLLGKTPFDAEPENEPTESINKDYTADYQSLLLNGDEASGNAISPDAVALGDYDCLQLGLKNARTRDVPACVASVSHPCTAEGDARNNELPCAGVACEEESSPENQVLTEDNIFNKLITDLLEVGSKEAVRKESSQVADVTEPNEGEKENKMTFIGGKAAVPSHNEGATFCQDLAQVSKLGSPDIDLSEESEVYKNAIEGTFRDPDHVIETPSNPQSNSSSQGDTWDLDGTSNSSSAQGVSRSLGSDCPFEFVALVDNQDDHEVEESIDFGETVSNLTNIVNEFSISIGQETEKEVAQLPCKAGLQTHREPVSAHELADALDSPAKCCNTRQSEFSFSSPGKVFNDHQPQAVLKDSVSARCCGITATLSSINLSPCLKPGDCQTGSPAVLKSVDLHSDNSQSSDKELTLSDLEAMGTQIGSLPFRECAGIQTVPLNDGTEMLERLLDANESLDSGTSAFTPGTVNYSEVESTKEAGTFSSKSHSSSKEIIQSDQQSLIVQGNNSLSGGKGTGGSIVLKVKKDEFHRPFLDRSPLSSRNYRNSIVLQQRRNLRRGESGVEKSDEKSACLQSSVVNGLLDSLSCQESEIVPNRSGQKKPCLPALGKSRTSECRARLNSDELKNSGGIDNVDDDGIDDIKFEKAGITARSLLECFEKKSPAEGPQVLQTVGTGKTSIANYRDNGATSTEREKSYWYAEDNSDLSDSDEDVDIEISNFFRQYVEKHKETMSVERPTAGLLSNKTKASMDNTESGRTEQNEEGPKSTEVGFKKSDLSHVTVLDKTRCAKPHLTFDKNNSVTAVSHREFPVSQTKDRDHAMPVDTVPHSNNRQLVLAKANGLQEDCDVFYTEWMSQGPQFSSFRMQDDKSLNAGAKAAQKHEERAPSGTGRSSATKDRAFLRRNCSELPSDEIRFRSQQKICTNNSCVKSTSVTSQRHFSSSPASNMTTAVLNMTSSISMNKSFNDLFPSPFVESRDDKSTNLSTSSVLPSEPVKALSVLHRNIGLFPKEPTNRELIMTTTGKSSSLAGRSKIELERRSLIASNTNKNDENDRLRPKGIISSTEKSLQSKDSIKLSTFSNTLPETRLPTADLVKKPAVRALPKIAKVRKRQEQPKLMGEKLFTFHRVPSSQKRKRSMSNDDQVVDSQLQKAHCGAASDCGERKKCEKEIAAEKQCKMKETRTETIGCAAELCKSKMQVATNKRKRDGSENESLKERKRRKLNSIDQLKKALLKKNGTVKVTACDEAQSERGDYHLSLVEPAVPPLAAMVKSLRAERCNSSEEPAVLPLAAMVKSLRAERCNSSEEPAVLPLAAMDKSLRAERCNSSEEPAVLPLAAMDKSPRAERCNSSEEPAVLPLAAMDKSPSAERCNSSEEPAVLPLAAMDKSPSSERCNFSEKAEALPLAAINGGASAERCISSEEPKSLLNGTAIWSNVTEEGKDASQMRTLESQLEDSLKNADNFFAKVMHKFEPHVLRRKRRDSEGGNSTICSKTLESCRSGTAEMPVRIRVPTDSLQNDPLIDSTDATSSDDTDLDDEIEEILKRKVTLERQIREIKRKLAAKHRHRLRRAKLINKRAGSMRFTKRRSKGRSFVLRSGFRKGKTALRDFSSVVMRSLMKPGSKVLEKIKDFDDCGLQVRLERLLPNKNMTSFKDFQRKNWYCCHCSNTFTLKPFSIPVNNCRTEPF